MTCSSPRCDTGYLCARCRKDAETPVAVAVAEASTAYLAVFERQGARMRPCFPASGLREARARAEGLLWQEPVEVRAACRAVVVLLHQGLGVEEDVEDLVYQEGASGRWGVVLRRLPSCELVPYEEQFPVLPPKEVLDRRRVR